MAPNISPKVGECYQHYKGGQYEVVGFAHHTETKEKLVLYKPLLPVPDLAFEYPDGVVFARPYSLFIDSVLVREELQPRFVLLNSEGEPRFVLA